MGGTGLSTLDLMGSSPSVNRVVRIMLKKNQMSYAELLAAVTDLPPEKRLTAEVLQEALNTLIQMEWLEKNGEGSDAVYNVILKPKASSAEQLHSTDSDLPPIDVATDHKVDPGLTAPEVTNQAASQPAAPQKKPGLTGKLKDLFGIKK
jgi:hypothetical protein